MYFLYQIHLTFPAILTLSLTTPDIWRSIALDTQTITPGRASQTSKIGSPSRFSASKVYKSNQLGTYSVFRGRNKFEFPTKYFLHYRAIEDSSLAELSSILQYYFSWTTLNLKSPKFMPVYPSVWMQVTTLQHFTTLLAPEAYLHEYVVNALSIAIQC